MKTSCPGISKFHTYYTIRRGSNTGKTRITTYYKVRVQGHYLGNFKTLEAALAAKEEYINALASQHNPRDFHPL